MVKVAGSPSNMLITTATELPRLMTCIGSRLMGDFNPSVSLDTTVRDEGVAAHYMAEQVYNGAVTIEELVDRKAPNGVYMTDDMAEHVQFYLNCLSIYGNGQMEIETNHSGTNYQVNGRADFGSLMGSHVTIADLKYGWTIIEPEKNWTLISHAVGLILKHPERIIETVTLIICQPRQYHRKGKFRSWTISYVELLDLYSQMQYVLSNPTDQTVTSDHCTKCKGLAACHAADRAGKNAIDVVDSAFNDTIPDNVLHTEIDTMRYAKKRIADRLQSLEELAMHRIKSGKPIKNYVVEQGLGNTIWNKGITADTLTAMTGKNMSKTEPLSPSKAIKAGMSEAAVKSLSYRPNTKLRLVRANTNQKAKEIFG